MAVENTQATSDVEKLLPIRKTLMLQLALGKAIEINGNTTWEQLTCAGYNPQTSNLEAVVAIKLPTGYSGGLCSPGSKEFVRFFIDYGSGFEDLGYTSFDVHDIPDSPALEHPIEYVVQMPLADTGHRQCCGIPVIPRVRAVLSWNTVPSANPNVLNTFGNRLDVHIQLVPKPFSLACLRAGGVLKDFDALKQFDLEAPLAKVTSFTGPSIAELGKVYLKEKVDAHRFLAPALSPLLRIQAVQQPFTPEILKAIKDLGIDVEAVLKALENAKADETYEQLTCAGLQTSFDTVGAVIQIKRPFGYSGDLCNPGSKEYVAFWADWDNSGTLHYLGTTSVDVHDLGAAMTPDGVRYSVSMLAPDIVQHLRSCGSPNVIRLRAVLSWNVPPSTTNPDELKTWGNRLDVHVQLRTGESTGTDLTDLIYRVGGVALSDISSSSHLAFPSTFLTGACGAAMMDRPWGGQVTIQGRIYNTGVPVSVRFRVRYKKHTDADIDANWTPVTGAQNFVLMNPSLPPPSEVPSNQVAGSEPGLGGGWFDYMENPVASPPIYERDNRLADWETGSLEGQYDLRLEYRRTTDPAGFYHQSNAVTITLHNYQMVASTAATATIDLTKDLDLVIDGGDCHSYTKSTSINGHLRVIDPYFGAWSFDLEPSTHTHGAAAVPSCRTYTSLADVGDGNLAWTLNTSAMDKCGYTLTLRGNDRTIIDNNGAIVHSNSKAVGFAVV